MLRCLPALAFALAAACGGHGARDSEAPAAKTDSTIVVAPPPVASAPKPAKSGNASGLVTAVFEDRVERTSRAPAREPASNSAPNPAPPPAPKPPPVLSEMRATLAAQLAQRGGIPWNPARPLQWEDFQAPPNPEGREAALSMTGQISGSACAGSQFQYGVIAAFIPRESWVLPRVAGNPEQSPIALAHERLHFDITEIIARELRQKFASVEKPCGLSEAGREAMGAAAFEEEKKVQQRYDDETKHGLDLAEQARWAGWAVTTLGQLRDYAATVGARDN